MAHEGERFCCVVIVRDLHRNAAIGGREYECRCDCGALVLTTLRKLRAGETNMCDACRLRAKGTKEP